MRLFGQNSSFFFQRALIVACAAEGVTPYLEEALVKRAYGIWSKNVSVEERVWWTQKAICMNFSSAQNNALLEHGVHPFELVYHDRSPELTILKELTPDAFRSGYAFQGLLNIQKDSSLELPDLQCDSIEP